MVKVKNYDTVLANIWQIVSV